MPQFTKKAKGFMAPPPIFSRDPKDLSSLSRSVAAAVAVARNAVRSDPPNGRRHPSAGVTRR